MELFAEALDEVTPQIIENLVGSASMNKSRVVDNVAKEKKHSGQQSVRKF